MKFPVRRKFLLIKIAAMFLVMWTKQINTLRSYRF